MMGTSTIEGELWGAHAEVWAQTEKVCLALWQAMLDDSGVGEGTRFLDLGCGSGGASVLAAERGAKVWGFDASANLLEIARRRVPGGDFRQGEIESLPYADQAFDVVFAANSIQYVGDKQSALREVRRVMADSGRFVIGMWCEMERCQMAPIFKAIMEAAPPPPDAPPTLSVRDNLVELVEDSGFTIEKEREVECMFEFENLEDAWEKNRAAGIMVGVARMIGEERLEALFKEKAGPFRDDHGRIRLSNWFRLLVCR
jgi:ubiquinone/menaquinone biosynthesis C-methylase UbiE